MRKTAYLTVTALNNLMDTIPRLQNIIDHIQQSGEEDVGTTEIQLTSNRTVSCVVDSVI